MNFAVFTHDSPEPIRPVRPIAVLAAVRVRDDADFHRIDATAKLGRDAPRCNSSKLRHRGATELARCVGPYAAKWVSRVPVLVWPTWSHGLGYARVSPSRSQWRLVSLRLILGSTLALD